MSDIISEAALLERMQTPRIAYPRFIGAAVAAIEAICSVLLVVMIVLLFAGVVSRYVFHSPIFWIDEVNSVIFLWLGMLGAAVAMHRAEHMRLTLFVELVPERWRGPLETFALCLVAVFLAAMVEPAIAHIRNEAIVRSPTLGIPNSYRIAAFVVGIGLMLVMVLLQIWMTARSVWRILAAVALIAAAAALLLAFKPTFVGLGQLNILIFLVGIIAFSLVIGVPIAFCFGLATLSFLFFTTSLPLSVMVSRMDEGMSGMILLSVPIFILLGGILDATGMGKAIVDLLSSLFGHVRAGMSYVLLGSLYLVSGISGSKVSDMATVAPALFPEMKRRGNKPKEMVALLATGAIMADTVPPSIVLIVLGSVAGLSIGALFTSGFVIAFVLLISLAIVARWKAGGEELAGISRAPFSIVKKMLAIAAPALVLPFLIRFAVGEGVATATEVSTIAVLYALVIGIFLYGGISPRRFYAMLSETAAMSGAILLIMGTALATAWALTQTGFAYNLTSWMTGLPGGWLTFMAASILIFMALGCLLEGLPALVLLAPLLFPIAQDLGIHGIHYAMVVVVAVNIGLFIPPIGIGFYLACSIGKVPPNEVLGSIWVYLLALIAGLVVITLVPALSIAYL